MGRMFRGFSPRVVVQFGKEASQTRDYCVAKKALRLLRMTIKLLFRVDHGASGPMSWGNLY